MGHVKTGLAQVSSKILKSDLILDGHMPQGAFINYRQGGR